jgi:glucose/arabinose dehydrogenase
MLAYGPDGALYISIGDGGRQGDPYRWAQNIDKLLGKILRINVGATGAYSIPANNPFVGGPGRDEIWAYGLRNPWRFSFDRQTGSMWIGDVGAGDREEVNSEPAGSPGGRNYGWNRMEGSTCFEADSCDKSGLTMPVWEYDRSSGSSVTGGYVYRGTQAPSLQGAYVYGDYVAGTIWTLRFEGGQWVNRQLLQSGRSVAGFGEDEAGELYVADLSGGAVLRFVEPSGAFCSFMPAVRAAP